MWVGAGNKKLSFIGFLFFALLYAWNLINHCMWGDEVQAWSICRESANLSELYSNLRYEGHPLLWYLVLWPVTQISGDPDSMKFINALFVLIALALIWLESPLSTMEKVLVCLSYPLVFNQTVLSRCYSLGIALTFLFLALCRKLIVSEEPPDTGTDDRKVLLGWILLGLMANVHFFFALLSAMLGLSWWRQLRGRRTLRLGVAIYLALGVLSAVCILRPSNIDGGTVPWFFKFSAPRLLEKLGTFGNTFFPLNLTLTWEYWDPTHPPNVGLTAGFVSLLLIVAYLRSQPFALMSYLSFSLALVSFFYLRHGGYSWHANFFFLGLLSTVWFLRVRLVKLGPSVLFTSLLLLNALGGAKTVVASKMRAVSGSQAAAAWIQKNELESEFLVAYPSFPTTCVAGYLDRPMYLVELEGEERFTRWNDETSVEPNQLHAALTRAMRRRKVDRAYLVVEGGFDVRGGKIPPELSREFRITELYRSFAHVVENYVIYRLDFRAQKKPHRQSFEQ